MTVKKAIIMAAGSGSRLYPMTAHVNKHLLAVYDKPMIYFPLSVLMLVGIKDILFVVNEGDRSAYEALLGDGSRFGISIRYAIQSRAGGIAEGLLVGSDFIDGQPVAVILGDNIFHGSEFIQKVKDALSLEKGGHVFLQHVEQPDAFGVAELRNGCIRHIQEKPKTACSNLAVTGLYIYDGQVSDKLSQLVYSDRGELEITDLNNLYASENALSHTILGRGVAWLDAGTVDDLFEAAMYVKAIENRQGQKISCPEEVAVRNGWISKSAALGYMQKYKDTAYFSYLKKMDI